MQLPSYTLQKFYIKCLFICNKWAFLKHLENPIYKIQIIQFFPQKNMYVCILFVIMSNFNKYLNNQPQIFVEALCATCGEGESGPKIAECKGFPKKQTQLWILPCILEGSCPFVALWKEQGRCFFLFASEYFISFSNEPFEPYLFT